MWTVALIFFSYVAAHVISHEIKMECDEFDDFPPVNSEASPSSPAAVKVELVTVEGNEMLNISWAINIDGSIASLNGTRIEISGEPTYHCEYHPPLAKANLRGSEQIWFHYLVEASYGYNVIHVANLPLPPLGSGLPYKVTTIEIYPPALSATPVSPQVTTVEFITEPPASALRIQDVAVIVFGGLAGLMILSSCYIIYKSYGSNVATSLGFKNVPAPPTVPVPVLVVYPAENSAFQRAVVALAEFLQWHGGCSVAIEMWQQGKIAELGPMRWLAEQAKAADRVLIVCPPVETPSSQLSQCPPDHSFPETSIPAAAHDLYPLILNMVASHAKSASELAKFWVVQLGAQQDKRPCILLPELRACKTFCLMKDLNKLCRSLHAERQGGKKVADMIFRPGGSYSEKTTVKLREAVGKLRGHQPSISREVQPLKSVITPV